MPSYRVKEKGFFDGKTYDPRGKRRVLHTDKALKPIPDWLEPIKESGSAAKKRAAAADKAAADKAAADKVEIDAVTFTEGPAPTQPSVETL